MWWTLSRGHRRTLGPGGVRLRWIWIRDKIGGVKVLNPRMSIVLFLLLFLIPGVVPIEDGRIGVLYIGAPLFGIIRDEPLFSLNFVAASSQAYPGWEISQVHRAIRLYMPRTYGDLVGKSDVIVLDNANRGFVTPSHIELLSRGVREGGEALLMAGGWESFGGVAGYAPWGETAIGTLLPTRDVETAWVESGRIVILELENELISSIPWQRKSPFMTSWHHNQVTAKQGSQVLAALDRNTGPYAGQEHPLFVTWQVPGGARTFSCTGGLYIALLRESYGGVSYSPWDYYGDFVSNLMIYLDRRPVPQDVDLLHAIREGIFETKQKRSLLLGLLEFVESLGANTQVVMRDLDSINELTARARRDYIELRFEDVLTAYEEMAEILDELEKDAVRIKNTALLWVYLVEWAAITGVGLTSRVRSI